MADITMSMDEYTALKESVRVEKETSKALLEAKDKELTRVTSELEGMKSGANCIEKLTISVLEYPKMDVFRRYLDGFIAQNSMQERFNLGMRESFIRNIESFYSYLSKEDLYSSCFGRTMHVSRGETITNVIGFEEVRTDVEHHFNNQFKDRIDLLESKQMDTKDFEKKIADIQSTHNIEMSELRDKQRLALIKFSEDLEAKNAETVQESIFKLLKVKDAEIGNLTKEISNLEQHNAWIANHLGLPNTSFDCISDINNSLSNKDSTIDRLKKSIERIREEETKKMVQSAPISNILKMKGYKLNIFKQLVKVKDK